MYHVLPYLRGQVLVTGPEEHSVVGVLSYLNILNSAQS